VLAEGRRPLHHPALVFTHDPETGKRNCGIYRMQVFDATTAAMHWQIHKHGAHHHRRAGEHGRRLEVACAIGADPALVFAAAAPLPTTWTRCSWRVS